MPDVSRSDSQRSDASQRPRVSFNRDVHVKRISTVASPRPPVEGGSLRLPVRRRLSRREGVAEARRALQQADKVACSASLLDLGDGFRSLRLPARGRKATPLASTTASSTSLTDLSAQPQPDRPKRRKEANGSTGSRGGSKLKRSQSERSSERPRRDPISAAFHSLERKRYKSKAQPEDSKEKEQDPQPPAEDTPISPPRRRHHSTNSDRSPSPRPRKNILKKSLSDSEAKPEDATAQPPAKKQLSPIIEDAPRAGYDFSADAPPPDAAPAMHSSQAPADRPPVTRGRTVETLVRRLSQETLNHKKKPPRGLSPSALVAPGEERRHNNNLPFSYTEPPAAAHGDRSAAASAALEGQPQVIYAEVVVGGGGSGKQTVHTQVPQRAAPPPQADAADAEEEDEGVSLSMDYGARNQLATDFRRANGFHSESRETAERTLPGGGKASTARREFAYSGVSPDGAYKKEYLVQESSSRYESSDLGLERGRADGMDSRRKDFLAERYDNGVAEHLFDPRPRRSFDLDDPRLYKDSLDGGADFYGRETPVIHDLSSRRDRLESRIESQRKERFSSYNKRDLSESVKKYATDPPRKAAAAADPRRYSNRRDFLSSQIDLDDADDDNVRYENDRNRRKSAASTRYLDLSTSTTTSSKKDFFADSGIEVDYRSKEPRRYDDVQTVEGPSAKIFIGGAGGRGSSSSPSSTNVTRVELRTGATPTTTPTPAATPTPALASDAEDDPRPGRHFYSSRTATAASSTNFSSTRLVQERHRSNDVLPASTVLIRHYAPAEDHSREPSPKHRDRDFPDPSPKHRDQEYREPSPKQRDREYRDPAPKHRDREFREPSPKHRDREYRDRDKDRDRERERDRDRERARDLDRERASRESRERRERHERHEHSASTSTASHTLSRTQREQRASEKLIRVERLAHGPEASDLDLDLDGRHSALDDTDVDERHYLQQQRRRREDDEEDLRSRRKKPSKKAAPDLREEEEQEDVRESEAEESRRADTIKRGGTLRAEDQRKKGPAPAPPKKDKDKKKQGSSAMDKVKQLFGGSSKKDKKKKKEKGQKEEADRKRREGEEEEGEEEDPVAARYTEYRGDRLLDTDEETLRATPHSTRRGNTTDAELSSQTLKPEQVSGSRQRLATPSPAATPSPGVLRHTRDRHGDRDREAGWFKSLDRLTKKSHGHSRARDKSDMETTDAGVTEDETSPRHHSTPGGGGKSLRFFGDTDAESVISIPPPAAPLSRRYKTNSALQASSKTLQVPTSSGTPSSGTLKAGNERRHHRSAGDVATSSAESTTEGDSSQQSQRSVVYLHAATVGDIPGPRSHATARRAQSREELSSVTSSQLQPQTKTISRSISVLAPWRPKHPREALEVHYTNEDNNRNYIKNGRPPKAPSSSSQHRQAPAGSGATTSRAVSRRRSGGADAASKIHAKQKVTKATSIESLSHKNGASGGVRHTLEMRNSAKKRAAGGGSLGPAGSVESLSRHSDHSNARLRGKERPSSSGKNSALNASAVELSTADNNSRGYKSSTHKKDTDRAKDSGKVSRSASMPKDTRVTAGWFKLRNKKQGT